MDANRLVLTFDDPNDKEKLEEPVRMSLGFSTYSDLTEKRARGVSFFCPLLLTGSHVSKSCGSGHQYKGGYLQRHLEAKSHLGVPPSWQKHWGITT